MKPWTRWQDWILGLTGLWLAISPWILTTTDNRSILWTALTGGIVGVVISVWALAVPTSRAAQWSNVVVGVLVFASPWVLGYMTMTAALWNACIVGALMVGLGFWNLPEVNEAILEEEASKRTPRAG
jgi:hypothetical protein